MMIMMMKVLLNIPWGKFDMIRWLDALCQRATTVDVIAIRYVLWLF